MIYNMHVLWQLLINIARMVEFQINDHGFGSRSVSLGPLCLVRRGHRFKFCRSLNFFSGLIFNTA